jgi:hypothetical protein
MYMQIKDLQRSVGDRYANKGLRCRLCRRGAIRGGPAAPQTQYGLPRIVRLGVFHRGASAGCMPYPKQSREKSLVSTSSSLLSASLRYELFLSFPSLKSAL